MKTNITWIINQQGTAGPDISLTERFLATL